MANKNRSPLSDDLDDAYRRRSGWLKEIAARGGRDESADLLHDAVVKTLEAGQRSEILDPVKFLYRVTRNTLFDRFRSRARRGRVLEYGLDECDAADPGAGPERAIIASERLGLALTIIERMPPRRREAFLLCRIEELTYAQAAKRMGVTVHAIEKHISLAMAQLYEEFGSD